MEALHLASSYVIESKGIQTHLDIGVHSWQPLKNSFFHVSEKQVTAQLPWFDLENNVIKSSFAPLQRLHCIWKS